MVALGVFMFASLGRHRSWSLLGDVHVCQVRTTHAMMVSARSVHGRCNECSWSLLFGTAVCLFVCCCFAWGWG